MAFSLQKIFSSLRGDPSSSVSRVVGVDVGAASVKVVELEQTEKTIILRTYGELQLGPYVNAPLGQAVVPEETDKARALADVLREAKVQTKSAVTALPLSSSFVTVISVNTTNQDDLGKIIPVEARKYIPVPMSDVTLDWTELPAIGDVESGVTEVLLAAIQTESLKSFSSLLQASALQNLAQEIEVFSSARALAAGAGSKAAVGIIDIGARVSKLYIVRNGTLERIHRVTTGGANVTQQLAALRAIEFADAELLKRNPGEDEAARSDVRKATQATLSGAVQEFQRIVALYENRSGAALASVTLVGGAVRSEFAQRLIADGMGRTVVVGNPFNQVAYPAFMEDTLKDIGPLFASSLGAALRQFQ